jgi:hypothetical protein
MGEKLGLLNEIALNFGAQRGLPGIPDREVKDDGGCKDDNKKGPHQFEENPIRHFGTSKR